MTSFDTQKQNDKSIEDIQAKEQLLGLLAEVNEISVPMDKIDTAILNGVKAVPKRKAILPKVIWTVVAAAILLVLNTGLMHVSPSYADAFAKFTGIKFLTDMNNNDKDIQVELENLPGNVGQAAENDENYFVIAASKLYVISKQTGEISPACKDITCEHRVGTCTYNHGLVCIKNYNGKIFLICNDFGATSPVSPVIYEMNPDTYELSVFLRPDEPVCYFDFYENFLIYEYADSDKDYYGWMVKDLSTGETRQLLDRIGFRPYFGIKDKYIYLTTQEKELYRINLYTSEKELVAKNCMDVVVYGNKLYFNRYNPVHKIFDVWSADETGEKKLISRVKYSFQIFDGQIFYVDGENHLMKADIDGKRQELITDGVEGYRFSILPGANKIIATKTRVGEDEEKSGYANIISVNFDGSDYKTIINFNQ